jgi:hypothetical protein
MSLLLDTDVLIEYLRGNPEIVERVVHEFSMGTQLYYSPVTKAEIVAGLRKGEGETTAKLFGLMACLVINEDTGAKAGEYMKAYRASHAVEIADALVAATAHQYDTPLWTLNRKHYPMKDIDFFSLRA